MRSHFAMTMLLVDEGSLASTMRACDLLRNASELRIPRVVLVGDARQLDAVDAGSRKTRDPGAVTIGDRIDGCCFF